MELRPLGKTGLNVSVIGLGTVKLGRTRGLKYASPAMDLPSDEQVQSLLETAAVIGVNLLDTAPAYGTSEERLGELMTRAAWLGGRDKWVVCAKAGEEFDADADGGKGVSRFEFAPVAVRASVERSLKRLRTEHIDVLLLHSDGRDEWIIRESGAMDELAALKARGLIRAFGISTKTVEGGMLAVEECDVVMVTHNPSHTVEQRVIDSADEAGVGVLVKKGLESGHTTDYAQAIRFVLATPGVSAMIVGTSSAEHLRANAAAVETVGE